VCLHVHGQHGHRREGGQSTRPGNLAVLKTFLWKRFSVAMLNINWRGMVGSVFSKVSAPFEKVFVQQNFSA